MRPPRERIFLSQIRDKYKSDEFLCFTQKTIQCAHEGTCPVTPASSDGRYNTCLQFTRGGLKSQGLSRALIQAQRNLIELCL